DGLRYCVYRYDFALATGVINNRKVFLQFEEGLCQPDGLTVDSEGYIWQAQWNSGKVFRYASNGELDQIINMPVTRPTSCIFGGEHLNILYVTSASRDRQETQSLSAPAGG